jgi:hypothetical protein
VGSDLDLIAVVKDTASPFEKRGRDGDFCHLPVPVDLVVYPQEQWRFLQERDEDFIRRLNREVMRIYPHNRQTRTKAIPCSLWSESGNDTDGPPLPTGPRGGSLPDFPPPQAAPTDPIVSEQVESKRPGRIFVENGIY